MTGFCTVQKIQSRLMVKSSVSLFSGEFGDVYRGILRRPLEDDLVVAIKTLKVRGVANGENFLKME